MIKVEVGDHCIIRAVHSTPVQRFLRVTWSLARRVRIKRPLSQDELSWIEFSADHYIELCAIYRAEAESQKSGG